MRVQAATATALLAWLTLTPLAPGAEPAKGARPGDARISFHKQIRPILQASCYGCHQPARAKGSYVMTDPQRLRAGGDSGDAAVVPGDPTRGALLELITPKDGAAEMPKGGKALPPADIDLIRQWIAQGAVDDTPANARTRYDVEHPPVYTRPPVITSLDWSPDGKLLAVAGFHEVLLWRGDGSALVARLVGLSERIQSLRFSPDGKQLAVTGGLPGRAGEVQVWDVATRKLALSVPVTFDTVYGVSWSPDGKRIAFGGGDNSVRAIDAKTGAQVLFQGAHNDWVVGTVFSTDGSHVVSVGRDRTAKLIEIANQRFVDNITSITPGALKGGILAVARHPKRDEIVIGGADGVPKVYRVFRVVKRVIGDDSNLIRVLPGATGRIGSISVSHDGKRIAVASALDGRGEVHVYSYEFDTKLPDRVKLIMMRRESRRSADDRAELERYASDGVKRIWKAPFEGGAAYAVAFRPDGGAVAAAGSNGVVRVLDARTGALIKQFSPAPTGSAGAAPGVAGEADAPVADAVRAARNPEPLPATAQIRALEVTPQSVALVGRADYTQLLVTARLTTGETIDVTRLVRADMAQPLAFVSPAGLVQPRADGETTLRLLLGGRSVDVPVRVTGAAEPLRADFVHDVNPVMSKLGCNQGTCHGAAQARTDSSSRCAATTLSRTCAR